jgi:hypothetical protein
LTHFLAAGNFNQAQFVQRLSDYMGEMGYAMGLVAMSVNNSDDEEEDDDDWD